MSLKSSTSKVRFLLNSARKLSLKIYVDSYLLPNQSDFAIRTRRQLRLAGCFPTDGLRPVIAQLLKIFGELHALTLDPQAEILSLVELREEHAVVLQVFPLFPVVLGPVEAIAALLVPLIPCGDLRLRGDLQLFRYRPILQDRLDLRTRLAFPEQGLLCLFFLNLM